MLRSGYAKMLLRIASGDLESKYRPVELLFQSPDFHAGQALYRGSNAGLSWLATADPDAYSTFARARATCVVRGSARAGSARSSRAVTTNG
jgi:hypothetical protein